MLRLRPSSLMLTRLCTVLAIVIGMLGTALFGANIAAAAVGGCRADPIVKLSDGTVLDITADIGTDAANITSISYVVHGPRKTALILSISTPTIGFKGKETFTYVADAPANTYITETVIETSVDDVDITAHTTFANVQPSPNGNAPVQYMAVNGKNGQVIRATVRH